jgi:shikimate kinase
MNRRIVIVGFMGSGKTTVAAALARKLGRDSIDLDSFITERVGRTPAEIIEQNGEAAFREIETEALRDVLENSDAPVIALGGGAWTIETNRALVAEHDCVSVWLDAPFELCWERIISSADTFRPMAPDSGSAKERFESRQQSYSKTELRLKVSREHDADDLATKIHQSRIDADV